MTDFNLSIALLIITNVILAIATSYNFYNMAGFRKRIERLIPAIACLLLAIRYIWILWFYVTDYYNDFVVRMIVVIVATIFFISTIWIASVFPLKVDSFYARFTNALYYFILIFLVIIAGLGIMLPSDPIRRDVNLSILYLFIIANIALLIDAILRVLYHWKSISKEAKLYFILLTLGVALISIGDLFFYFIEEWMLRQIAPIFGFVLIIFADYGSLLLPFISIINRSDLCLAIVSTDYKLIDCNISFRQYINPELLTKNTPIAITTIWKDKTSTLIPAFDKVIKEGQHIQISEKLYNYSDQKSEFMTVNLYPLENRSVGLFLIKSDELQYLKERKEFLFDVLTHDIANVDQILQLSLESFQREDFANDTAWEKLKFTLKQSDRLQQLIFSIHNLHVIDKYGIEPLEIVQDFDSKLLEIIRLKLENYSHIKVVTNEFHLKPIRSTGHLKAAFSLLFDAIFESCEEEIEICTEIDTSNNPIESVIIKLNTRMIHPDLLKVYSIENKSELVSQSSVRVNLIVATAIIEKNRGNIEIKQHTDRKLQTEIVVSLPYIDNN